MTDWTIFKSVKPRPLEPHPTKMFVKKSHTRIVLCGASSVGKTTLANDWCRKHKKFQHIQEVARDVMKRDNLTREHLERSLQTDKQVFLNLQHEIIKEQDRREQEFVLNRQSFISDRGPDPVVYVHNFVGKEEANKLIDSKPVQSCFERYQNSLVVILSILDQSTDDGFRLVPNKAEQEQFTETLMSLLDEHHIPYLYMRETDRKLRLECLENAVTKGILPFDYSLMTNRSLSVCFPLLTPAATSTISVPTVNIRTDSIELTFSLIDKGKTNRMIDRYGIEQFVLVSFDGRVSYKTVCDILNKGVWINGNEYQFLGCSSSGLKQRKCYMFKGDLKTVGKVLKECGSFESIKSVSKQLKRIGQLFSAAVPTGVSITGEQVRVVDDIETRGGNFTDGCGGVSENIAMKILEGANIEELDYIPSVFQIRYEGCKGIVVRNPSLSEDALVVRKSMKKFNSGSKPFNTLWLCDYSKPYSYGHLNKQYILLLSALGVKDDVFIKKQSEYFEKIEKMTSDSEVAIEMLGQKKPHMAISIVNCSSNIHKSDIQKELSLLRSKCIEKMEKLRIIITESRNVFGVCDPLEVLEYGECFVRPTIRGKPQTVSGLVTVSKNPCYLLGDVRVLHAVDDDRTYGLQHLVDCIVFPVKGERPHPSEIAGSDLDGDMYFVCWDKELIAPRVEKPYDYPSTEAPQTSVRVTQSMRIDYMSGMNRESQTMGKIDSYFNYWADVKGAGCEECVSLGKLFSRSVDASKTGDIVPINSRLKPPVDGRQISETSNAVWKVMLGKAKEKKEQLQKQVVNEMLCCEVAPVVSERFILDTIQQQSTYFTEYQLFQLVRRWCLAQNLSDEESVEKLTKYSMYINFGKLTVDQKVAIIDSGIPQEIVTNALNKSKLLSREMLSYFSLHTSLEQWNFYFHSSSFDFNWDHMLRALEHNDECLIVLHLPGGVTIGVHFLDKVHLGITDLNSGSVIAYFFSAHFGLHQRHVLGQDFTLNLNDELLQIYKFNDVRKTFVCFRKEIEIENRPRNSQSGRAGRCTAETCREYLYDRLSVDLTQFRSDIIRSIKHPKVNKQEFQEIEVFVKRYSIHEPAYFDIYMADQPDILYPELVSSSAVVEDIPEYEPMESGDTLCEEISEDYLYQLAEKGNFHLFFKALDSVHTKCQPQSIPKLLLLLLRSIHVQYGCSVTKNDLENHIQKTVLSLSGYFEDVEDCLDLLERLCWLSNHVALEETVTIIIHKLQLSDFSAYIKLVSDWMSRCILPISVAQEVSCHLYILCQSFLEKETESVVPLESVDQSMKQYVLYHAHRILLYFIKDVSSQNESNQNSLLMMKANIMSYDQHGSTVKINFHRTDNIYSSIFSVGTYVMIISQKDTFPVALGRISHITKHPPDIEIEVNKPVPKCLLGSAKTNKGHWMLRLIGNVTMFRRSINALDRLLNKREQSTELVPLLIQPHLTSQQFSELQQVSFVQKPDPDLLALDGPYNSSQKEAIKTAVKQRLTLIHGPPGTGKTHVACAIVEQFLHCCNPTSKVLVTAETNMAVDNLTRKLLQKDIKVVRVSSSLSHVSPDVRHSTLLQQIEQHRLEAGHDKSRKSFPERKVANEILKHAEVVATTCTGAGDPLLESLSFQFVLIDEATLVIEPVSLIPIALDCCQLVLIGDPQQLAPSIPGKRQEGSVADEQVNQLSLTLFHRLSKVVPSHVHFLNEQHRMHPSIAKFPSEYFYKCQLKSASCLSEREPLKIPWIKEDEPMVFIDASSVEKLEKQVGTSYCNKTEASLAAKVIKSLINYEISPMEITVLTPYVGQVKCIKEELALVNDKIEVSTIDRFQGRENDVIIFSTVRCNYHGVLGFTDDPNRMNVLLTRAKKCLIGIGSKDTLEKNSILWASWLQKIHVMNKHI